LVNQMLRTLAESKGGLDPVSSRTRRWLATITLLVLCLSVSGVAEAASDFGAFLQSLLFARAFSEFGIVRPLDESSPRQVTAAEAQANPLALVTLAPLLKARVVTSTPARRTST